MTDAILLVAHGSPETIDQLPEFLANIRRGRPTPPELVREVQRRYAAIGGRSPLLDTTREQARLLSERVGLPAFVAMRMWHPYLHETLRETAARGINRLLTIVMAPHSAFIYEAALRQAARELSAEGVSSPELIVAPCIGDEPALIDTFASLVREQLRDLDPRQRSSWVLLPSAHSLPMRTIEAGDPYPSLVEKTAHAVIERLAGDALPSILTFQSQGMTSEAWLGPDLPTVFERVKATGAKGVIVAPVGFLADHVETLYDLDIEARELASEAGLELRRARCPNTEPGLIDALEAVVRRLGR